MSERVARTRKESVSKVERKRRVISRDDRCDRHCKLRWITNDPVLAISTRERCSNRGDPKASNGGIVSLNWKLRRKDTIYYKLKETLFFLFCFVLFYNFYRR